MTAFLSTNMDSFKLFQTVLHYSLHLIAPAFIAYHFYRARWMKVWGILVLTMLVDLDHLLANPIFDPNRCSIGTHYLHTYTAIVIYAIAFMLTPKNSLIKIISIGLLFHMVTDFIDCKVGMM